MFTFFSFTDTMQNGESAVASWSESEDRLTSFIQVNFFYRAKGVSWVMGDCLRVAKTCALPGNRHFPRRISQ